MDSDTRDLLYDARYETKLGEKVSHVIGNREREGQVKHIDAAIALLQQARQAIIDSKPNPAQFAGIADCGSDL